VDGEEGDDFAMNGWDGVLRSKEAIDWMTLPPSLTSEKARRPRLKKYVSKFWIYRLLTSYMALTMTLANNCLVRDFPLHYFGEPFVCAHMQRQSRTDHQVNGLDFKEVNLSHRRCCSPIKSDQKFAQGAEDVRAWLKTRANAKLMITMCSSFVW
jgi:hypothetical protein